MEIFTPAIVDKTCYDHLAGKAGIAITNALLQKKITVEQTNNYADSAQDKWFGAPGIDINNVLQMKQKFAYPSLYWSKESITPVAHWVPF